MALFTTEHTARKAHECGLCGGPIESGQRYTMQVVSPGDVEVDNTRWMRTRVCLGGNCHRYDATPRKRGGC
jgi:hypothetical protein